MRWTEERNKELRDRWDTGQTRKAICAAMELSDGQFMGRRRVLNLPSRGRGGITLRASHAAISESRTLFPSTVRAASDSQTVLRPAATYQKKLGAKVLKGAWRGMQIYSLTLEERATCPHDCPMLLSCYGNNMHMATRFRHGTHLEAALYREVEALARKHSRGFVVRLHILGDFMSVGYVLHWLHLLHEHPELNIFGYSAWQRGTEIGEALEVVRAHYPKRFAVRVSGSSGPNGAIVVDDFADCGDAIPCPVETGKSPSCGACALCWTADRPIAFKRH
jgi:hypothetical protein